MAIESGIESQQQTISEPICSYTDEMGNPLLIVEFKAPAVKVTQNAFDQIAHYNMKLQVPFLIVSNGLEALLL